MSTPHNVCGLYCFAWRFRAPADIITCDVAIDVQRILPYCQRLKMKIRGSGVSDPASEYSKKRRAHWGEVASDVESWPHWSQYYHRRIEEIYRHLVTPGMRVLEIGSGPGDLLAVLEPSEGLGIDFSDEMIRLAQSRHPDLTFIQADIHDLEPDKTFDVIIMSDLLNDLWDVEQALRRVYPLCEPHTRVIINCYSRLWELPLAAVKEMGLARPTLYQNWLTVEDIGNLLLLTDFQVIRHWSEILYPFVHAGP